VWLAGARTASQLDMTTQPLRAAHKVSKPFVRGATAGGNPLVPRRALRSGRKVATPGRTLAGHHPARRPVDVALEGRDLFNLVLAAARPDRVKALAEAMEASVVDWRKSTPLQLSDETEKQLRALGYVK